MDLQTGKESTIEEPSLYKYCVSQMSWSSTPVEPPTNVELTPRQKILFSAPGDPYRHFPSLFD